MDIHLRNMGDAPFESWIFVTTLVSPSDHFSGALATEQTSGAGVEFGEFAIQSSATFTA